MHVVSLMSKKTTTRPTTITLVFWSFLGETSLIFLLVIVDVPGVSFIINRNKWEKTGWRGIIRGEQTRNYVSVVLPSQFRGSLLVCQQSVLLPHLNSTQNKMNDHSFSSAVTTLSRKYSLIINCGKLVQTSSTNIVTLDDFD